MSARNVRTVRLVLLVLLVLLLGGASVRMTRDLPAGTGFSAWQLCTFSFQSRMPFVQVRARYVEPVVKPLPALWNVEFDAARKHQVAVAARVPFFAHRRAAVYRPGLGCTPLPPGVSEAAVRAQPFRPISAVPPDFRAWPRGEGSVERELSSDATQRVLAGHVPRLLGEPEGADRARQNTTALLIAQRGHLVFERYGQGFARENPQLGWSMTKTLTALLVGMLEGDGKLSLDASLGYPAWRGTEKARITWRHLLTMSSGLAWEEGHGGQSVATEMLFSQADQGAFAASQPLVAPPGSTFQYSTGSSTLAMFRMRQLLGGDHQAIYEYTQHRLFMPLGIRGGVIEPDVAGTPGGGARGVLRPVDWLRLGQLIADGGRWEGRSIVPAAHLAFMRAPSPANPGFGGSLWTVESDYISPALRARLPRDLVWFAGYQGQYMIVIPSRALVVLRMGVSLGPDAAQRRARQRVFELVADLIALPDNTSAAGAP